MKKNDEVLSLEQMRILLHISKRKAAWMLQNQVIPCIVNDQMTTHKYMVRREDVDAFLRLPVAEQNARIPVGQFNARGAYRFAHPELHLKLTEPDRAEFVRYLEDFYASYPNALTLNAVREMTGYCRTTVNNWIAFGYVASAQLIDGPRIPKQSLIQFLASDRAFDIRIKSEIHIDLLHIWEKASNV